MQKPRYIEQARVHIPLATHIRMRAVPGLVWWHSPQGAYYGGSDRQGALMKALGVRPGVSDLVFLLRGQFYALELKRLKGGRASPEQEQFLADVEHAGGVIAIAAGLDEALAVLERWGLIQGSTQYAMELIPTSSDVIKAKAPRMVRKRLRLPVPRRGGSVTD